MLKVEHLGKFKDHSFYLSKGYICGLIGENGAGKTTFLRMLTGSYKKMQGKICSSIPAETTSFR